MHRIDKNREPERILMVHNHYRFAGGEDVVFQSETRLLSSRGHKVRTYTMDNRTIDKRHPLSLAMNTIWNRQSYIDLRGIIKEWKPDVIHFHNTFPMISPSVYDAAYIEGVPVVQTLHNYRLMCLNGALYRNGRVCEECIGKGVSRGILYGCYRQSFMLSGVTALMLQLGRIRGTWKKRVGRYITLTEFGRRLFIRGGLPAERITVKPNFIIPDPGSGSGVRDRGALYVGRLSVEKGIDFLLNAWSDFDHIPLTLIGAGRRELEKAGIELNIQSGISLAGFHAREDIISAMKKASFVILPSRWYEAGTPLVILEALATSTPVLVPGHGGIGESLVDGKSAVFFNPGDVEDLAEKVRWAWEHPEEMQGIGAEGRKVFERCYTADRNYKLLLTIYREVTSGNRSH